MSYRNLKDFTSELHDIIITNDINTLKIKAIKEEIENIKNTSKKYDKFSEINLSMNGIVYQLEQIISK